MEYICKEEENGVPLERLLKNRGLSRRSVILLKHTQNGITRDGEIIKTTDKVFSGDRIILSFPKEKGFFHQPNSDLKVNIAYEDDSIIIFDKPPHMPVHISAGHKTDTLANAFAAICPNTPFRAVNRLDSDTSGLCLVAKNRQAANVKECEKIYLALCCGRIEKALHIDLPIGREEGSVIKRTVRPDGVRAVTDVFPEKICGKYTLVRVSLSTGRTHQIRVHLSNAGFPLAGDSLYGGDSSDITRQALHCYEMSLSHPLTGERISAVSPMYDDICKVLQKY